VPGRVTNAFLFRTLAPRATWVVMVVWKGTCLQCGHTRWSKRWTQYPQGYPIPDDYPLDPDVDREECRLCRPCYNAFVKSKSANQNRDALVLAECHTANAQAADACTPVTVTHAQRRRSSPTMAIPGRSSLVRKFVYTV
jgi:hypothetical protein